ncbi:TAXI family TRAP transporter solute-binding subunit [Allocoleopsis franciscana]|uniref:TRAP transporter solute receptor, TAXI family n=1 Tax=Allocoleopsis franciscana PCC 7113 TaxID=1173027 RepID=K9W9W4_9CYAN|nr:TAXI family TRAP transporter solute-binding subunit [Allocoleopsis franciscana]AFZ17043.1 TRAP transporter solute receptor, TAXI family [Allocoleopsis franciscana PCC 7113]
MNSSKKLRKPNRPNFFHHLDPLTILVFLSLGGLTIGLVAAVTWHLVYRNQVHHLTLVAGNRDGESYILSQAIEKVVEANNPKITIDVKETGGTTENIKLLEAGKAQLATAQADVPAGSSARAVAVLYRDIFQLVVKQKPEINHFSDLKGKRIGLPQTGGQFRSFIHVAKHYGLKEEDFQFIGANDEDADQAFRQNRVDAVFRVRALGNTSILELVQKHQGRLLSIEQAAAMRIKYPAFEPTIIPQGAYKGSLPSVPVNALPTVAVQRVLLANEKVDKSIIQEITAILDEHRQEIADAIPKEFDEVKPLVAGISSPSTTGGTGIPTHLGAIAFYERDKPSFIQENADYVGLILTIALLLGSWIWQLKSWIEQGKKDAADLYIKSAIELMKDDDRNPEMRLK